MKNQITKMKKSIFLFLLIAGLGLSSHAQEPIDHQFFNAADQFFQDHVKDGLVDYSSLIGNASFDALIEKLGEAEIDGLSKEQKIAFYINAYNLLVIKKIVDHYPLPSVWNEVGFFGAKDANLAGELVSLNTIEKEYLLKGYPDPRYHFVLVCGAVGCPPLASFAYRPESLEDQLESQTQLALNNPKFIQLDTENKKVKLSQIFAWYKNDFGGDKTKTVAYINPYRNTPIPADYSIGFYTYDWSVNQQPNAKPIQPQANNQNRYIISATIPKRSLESKSFYNLYTDRFNYPEIGEQRYTQFTTTYSVVYGLSDRFNIGLDLRYRRVRQDDFPASPFRIIERLDGVSSRQGFTNIGPKIRWSPTQYLPNFSIQSAFWLPLGRNLEGDQETAFLDFDGATWFTQLANDVSLGNNFSLYTELDFLLEDIGNSEEGDLNRFSTPLIGVLSYYPSPKTSVFASAQFSPFWQEDFEYFVQAGLGIRHQFTKKIEADFSITPFRSELALPNDFRASTFNVGFRFSR